MKKKDDAKTNKQQTKREKERRGMKGGWFTLKPPCFLMAFLGRPRKEKSMLSLRVQEGKTAQSKRWPWLLSQAGYLLEMNRMKAAETSSQRQPEKPRRKQQQSKARCRRDPVSFFLQKMKFGAFVINQVFLLLLPSLCSAFPQKCGSILRPCLFFPCASMSS